MGLKLQLERMLEKDWQVFLLFVLVIAVLYGNTLNVPFYFDDIPQIIQHPATYDLGAAFRQIVRPRGIVSFSFALNNHFFGMSLPAFHVVNIVLHLLTTCFVFLLLKRVFPDVRLVGVIAALLFLCHPLQTQTVNYVVQRMTGMSGFFAFLSLYLFTRAREQYFQDGWRNFKHSFYYGGFALAASLSVLAKQNAATLPMMMLLFDATFLSVNRSEKWHKRFLYLSPIIIAPIALALIMLIKPIMAGETLARLGNFENLSVNRTVVTEATAPLHYFVTEFAVFWLYIKLLFVPTNQLLDYGYPLTEQLLSFKNVAAGSGLVLMAIGAVCWRRRIPCLSFALGWMLLALLVESTFIPLDPVFEHRLYVPMFGFCVFIGSMLKAVAQHYRVQAMSFAVVLLVVFSIMTVARNHVWADPLAFYQNEVRHTINSYRPRMMLADEYYKRGEKKQAKAEYDKVVAMIEKGAVVNLRPKMLQNLAVAYGRFDDYKKAEQLLRLALQKADAADLHYNLGVALILQERREEAFHEFSLAYKRNPGSADTLYYYILLSGEFGNKEQLPRLLNKMTTLNPVYANDLRKIMGSR